MEIGQWIVIIIGGLIMMLPVLRKIKEALADDGKIDKEEAIDIAVTAIEVIKDDVK